MVTAETVKRWVRQGLVRPSEGSTAYAPGWGRRRQLWHGFVDGYYVRFYPDGAVIDMTTFRVGRKRRAEAAQQKGKGDEWARVQRRRRR